MRYITNHLVYTSDFILEIFPITGAFTNFDTKNSKWVLCEGEFQNKTTKVNGTFAACTSSDFSIKGKGIVIKTPGYCIAEEFITSVNANQYGHLSYIDGCSNTGLIGPVRNGFPCINYLYFPENTKQTIHTHPSCRIGMILNGSGEAEVNGKIFELNTGDLFLLDKFTKHRFLTNKSHMSLMVFHPDSEDGPKDEFNPMKSRTYF